MNNYCKHIICLLLLFVGQTNAAEIYIHKYSDQNSILDYIGIVGEIRSGDADKLASIASQWCQALPKYCEEENKGPLVYLKSEGGDLGEALDMGRLIRKFESRVKVPENSVCYSSCVLLLSGALKRSVSSSAQVGIHRPFFADIDASASLNEVRQQLSSMNVELEMYLRQMGMSDRLYEDMLSIPPGKIKVLNEEELQLYRLNVDDAASDEKSVATRAQYYGITSIEYRKREAAANEECFLRDNGNKRSADCYGSMMWNMSESQYTQRYKRAYNICGGTLPKECFSEAMLAGD